ncbi:MAG: alpha/beta fold hydrolase [Ilumatobacteraceae bacterium]
MSLTPNGIFYETFGDPAHPTLVLVNGLGSQCINYAHDWCRMFASEGLHVVRFDNRDVGHSRRFAGAPVDEHGAAYTLADMAGDVVDVLDTLGVPTAHVMGLSMGGMIVQQLALDHPHRVVTMTSVMSSTGEPEYRRSTMNAQRLLTEPGATTREGYVQQWIEGLREWGSPAFADEDRWRAEAERAWDRGYDPAGVQRQYLAILASPPRADRLRSLTVPTLVIHGDRDTLIDQIGGHRTAELIPGARLEIIEGMGHDYPPGVWRQWTDLVVGHIRAHAAPH